MKEVEQEYRDDLDDVLLMAREARAKYESDRPFEVLTKMYMNRFQEVQRQIKYFQVKRDDTDPSVIARAKSVPIPTFIKFNRDNTACCIWHNEKTPSMHYYEKQNRVKCFGCDKLGDVIDVVQQLQRVGLKEAVKIILQSHGKVS